MSNNIIYTAVFFNTNEVVSKYKQVHPNLYSHHSTIEFKPTDISNLPIGEEINIKVIGRLTNDKVDVLLVKNPLSKNKFPHITLSTAEGIKPFQSNTEIENNQDKIKPINNNLIGIVGYFDGSEKTQLEEMEVSKKDLENQKLINQAHSDITRTKGKNYAPNKDEITKGELEEAKKFLIKENYSSDDINDIFKQNPQLGLIGTPQEYAKYLNTLFPSSKYKDIYYHQGKEMFDVYDFSKRKAYSSDLGKGLYLSKDKEVWKQYASGHRGTSFSNPVNTLYFKVNLINPHVTRDFFIERMNYNGKKDYVDVVRRTNDGIVEVRDRDDFNKEIPKYVFQMIVFDSKNYLRLGSKQDTINFQKFLGKNKYSENEIENLIKQYNPTLNTSKVFMGSFETDVLYKGMKTKERLNKNPILKNKVFAILGLTDNDDEKAKRKGIEIYAKYLLAYPNGNLNGFEKFIKSNHEFLDTPSIVDAEWNQQFEGIEISKGELEEEKKKKADRCLRIARNKMPQTSAYRSGNIVRCRQGKIWKGLKEGEENFGSDDINLSGHKNYKGLVIVHRNLNKPPYFSIKKSNGGQKIGKVIGYDTSILLKDIKFVIIKGGQERVRSEQSKNVHAGTVGKIVSSGGNYDTNGWTLVTYNPYTDNTFIEVETGEPIYNAKEAVLKNTREIWVKKEDALNEKTDFSKEKKQGLHGWFARQGGKGKSKGWVDCNTCRDGKCKSCGRKEGESRAKYPACRPTPSACKTKGKGKSWGKKSKLNEEDYSDYNTSVISLFYNGKVLILQRGSTAPWMPNKWSIVGGVVDEGEDFKETVIRETNEEIGQSPINVKYIKQVMTQDSGNIIYYIGDLKSDEINLDYENQDYKFIGENEIENFEFVPHVVEFIKESFRIKKSKTNEEFPIQSLYREKENMEIKKKDMFDEDLILKRDQSKNAIYVQSDLDNDKARSQETFKNKEALKSAGFKWDGDIKSWKTDDVNFMLAKKTIETINKKEYLINQLEELEEIVANSENTPEKPTLMSKIDMYINDLSNATDEAAVSAEIRRYLTFFSKFRVRSVINTWLIYIQSGGKATKVEGFRKWEKLFHRRVKKGAKGYQIFVPLDKGKKITQKDDETGEEITTKNITRFGVGYVFDIADTEPIDERGEIPETPKWYADLEPTERSIELYKYFIELCEDMGIEISKSDSERGEKGYSAGNKINISSAREGAGEVSTLVHEIAHELMHWKKSSIYFQENTDAELRELQAESVSYVVLKNYDLPTEHHSTYLALWKANKDKIKDNIKVISSVASFIISEIDKIEKRNQKNEVINEQTKKDIKREIKLNEIKNTFKRLLK